MKKYKITPENVKLVGRTYDMNDITWLTLSGSGADFFFTGKKLTLTVAGREASQVENNRENYARLAVYVNDIRVMDDLIDATNKNYTLLDYPVAQTVSVKIIKLSECAMSMCGLVSIGTDDEGRIFPTEDKPHKIEIIGDSITCGYGVDDEDCEHHFATATEDVTKAYSYLTVKALNADYSFFSTSGHGIISGYTDDINVKHTDQLIPDNYHNHGLCYDTFDGKLTSMEVAWDFNRFVPDIVVINLGTNDDSYCQDDLSRQNEYKDAYIAFLKDVRAHNESAKIFCILGLMGSRLYPFICKACEEYTKETGDDNIETFRLPEQDGNIGYAADYHPMARFHDVAAKELVKEIKDVMHW